MSYTITCYCNDETITKTSVYIPYLNVTYTENYGSSSLGDYEEFSVTGFDSSWSAKFTATPSSNCSFYRWVYRVGDSNATVQYNYSETFIYTEGQDIYIRAEGKSDSSLWTLHTGSFGTVNAPDSIYVNLGAYELYRYSVSFESSGTATFYTTGSVDTYGYLSDTSTWDNSLGQPNSYLSCNDDGADNNFLMAYDVTAGKTYYVWLRSCDGNDTGDVYLSTTSPSAPSYEWGIVSSSFGELHSNGTENITINPYTLYRWDVTFTNSGTAVFYTTGSVDTYGYLSKSSAWDIDLGQPTRFLKQDDNGAGVPNFSMSYDVTAGEIYYIWVRGYSATTAGSTALCINVPAEEISITKWSWSASNGNASASQTSAAYSAVVNKTAVTNFSYLVWNDLCDKVKEILDATSGSWDSTYATYANTKMSSNDKILTATKFNSLRYNIGSHYSTGIYDVSANDDVLGSYFTTLVSCINGWIDTL